MSDMKPATDMRQPESMHNPKRKEAGKNLTTVQRNTLAETVTRVMRTTQMSLYIGLILWPIRSSIYIEKISKLKLTANNISSTDINIIIIFFRPNTIPHIPKVKISVAIATHWTISKIIIRLKPCCLSKQKKKQKKK